MARRRSDDEPSYRVPRSVPRTVELEPGVLLTVQRMSASGPYGFVVKTPLETFAGYDCRWTDEEAEAMAVRAFVIRAGL